jgi:hypothetical protein
MITAGCVVTACKDQSCEISSALGTDILALIKKAMCKEYSAIPNGYACLRGEFDVPFYTRPPTTEGFCDSGRSRRWKRSNEVRVLSNKALIGS